MKGIEKALSVILVISAATLTFYGATYLMNFFAGTSPATYNEYQAWNNLRQNIWFLSTAIIGIVMIIVGIILYKKYSNEIFSVVSVSYGALVSLGNIYISVLTIFDWKAALILFIVSLVGLIYITRQKKKEVLNKTK